MTFEEAYNLGSDPVWRGRCQTAALKSATSVMSEEDTTAGHAERTAFANKVLLSPALQSQAIAFGVAAQPGITDENATDSDIEFTINSLWDAWSGVA